MKNWKRIFLVCFVLIGSTAFFGYWMLNQFNNALDDLSASNFVIAKISPIPSSGKTNKAKAQIPTSAPETILASTISLATSTKPTDLKLSFIFPKKDSEVYIGCTYQLSFQSLTTIRLLEIALLDDGTNETIDPTASGLARENKIEPNSQSLDWKVGVVWPGKYYIKVSNINGVELENYSKTFTIKKMPKDISVDEREKICPKTLINN